jgi:cysteine desulfurase
MYADDARVRRLRDAMAYELLALPGSLRIGAGETLPGILNIAFAGTYAENLMLLCDLRGVCLSAGSACHAGNDTPSHVLEAMGVPEEYRSSAIRISIGRFTSAEDAAEIAAVVRECVALAREG